MTNTQAISEIVTSIDIVDAGIRIDVTKTIGGYSVTLFDVDAGERLPSMMIYKTKADAIAKAMEIGALSKQMIQSAQAR